MLTRIVAVVVFAFLTTTASAADYGVCANNIADIAGTLIAPVAPVQTTSVVTDEVAVLVVKGMSDGDTQLGDDVVEVTKMYQPELYSALKAKPTHVWIGVIEGVDGAGEPALWMNVWVSNSKGCVQSPVGERVYEERANAPNIFWKEVRDWESSHPEVDHLVHTPQ